MPILFELTDEFGCQQHELNASHLSYWSEGLHMLSDHPSVWVFKV
jgi:hypothetical protein